MSANRCTLEVLKFLSALDVLKNTNLVSKEFAALSQSNELWHTLVEPLLGAQNLANVPPKDKYRMASGKYLPVLSPRHLLKFVILTETWHSVNLSTLINVDRFLSIVKLDHSRLFVTGAPEKQDTFTVQPVEGTITFLEPLHFHRNSMGVIAFQNKVYAFCGYNPGYRNETEVYSESGWKDLPNSSFGRSAFNPCEHDRIIYLVGGCGTNQAESFNVDSNTFSTLLITTPGEYCTAAVWIDTLGLVALQQMGYYQFDLEIGSSEMKRYSFDFGLAYWSNCEVISLNSVYYVHQEHEKRIVAVDLATLKRQFFPIKDAATRT